MKASSILIAPVVDLMQLPDADRSVMRRVLFEHIRGMDAPSDAAWRRWWGRVFNEGPGVGRQLYAAEDRNLSFHNRWFAIERRVFESQDFFVTLKGFRWWMKAGAGFGEYQMVGERMRFIPHSLGFDECSDEEMQTFVADAQEFLRSDRAQRRLWRHLPAIQRADMMEQLMGDRGV